MLDTRHLPAALRQIFDAEDVPLQQAAELPPSYMNPPLNRIKIVNQLKISGKDNQTRIPDGILYINGLPLVVFNLKCGARAKPVLAMHGSSSVSISPGYSATVYLQRALHY